METFTVHFEIYAEIFLPVRNRENAKIGKILKSGNFGKANKKLHIKYFFRDISSFIKIAVDNSIYSSVSVQSKCPFFEQLFVNVRV